MDFIEQLQALSSKIQKHRNTIQTEEATKSAFVLPFIKALGYDVFDPSEVVPEFTADVGIKKGEKVDYAIIRDNKKIMLFECKKSGTNLDEAHISQLYRYFSVTEARIGVLTDGIVYRFYMDLEEPNKLDPKPFMEINLLEIQESLILELKRLTKDAFNLDEFISTAGELKYTREIKRLLGEQLLLPSDEFIRFFAAQVYTGKLTQSVREQFSTITKRAFTQFINERINERLKSAMTEEISAPTTMASIPETREPEIPADKKRIGITTTEEELHGYYIVKAILRDIIDPKRISQRDTLKYFGILLDDTNRKPICRLYFNSEQKYMTIFNSEKNEEKFPISDLNDLFKYTEQLRYVVESYKPKPTKINSEKISILPICR